MQAVFHAALVADSLPTMARMGQIALRSKWNDFNTTVQIDCEHRTVIACPIVMTVGAGDFMQRIPPKLFYCLGSLWTRKMLQPHKNN